MESQKLIAFVKKHGEIVAYLFWGGMTTVVSWASFALFSKMLGAVLSVDATVTVANIISWVCAIVFAFVVNKIWVFRSKSWKKHIWWPECVKFVSARVVTGVLEIVGVPLLVKAGLNQQFFGIEGMISKMIVSVLVIILNYFFSKFFVFKEKKHGH